MNRSNTNAALSLPVKRALRKLGGDLKAARARRRIPVKVMAERAFMSRMTLNKIEKGDPGVTIGAYGAVLGVLGMAAALEGLADQGRDLTGRMLADEQLPKRIRLPRARPEQEQHGS